MWEKSSDVIYMVQVGSQKYRTMVFKSFASIYLACS